VAPSSPGAELFRIDASDGRWLPRDPRLPASCQITRGYLPATSTGVIRESLLPAAPWPPTSHTLARHTFLTLDHRSSGIHVHTLTAGLPVYRRNPIPAGPRTNAVGIAESEVLSNLAGGHDIAGHSLLVSKKSRTSFHLLAARNSSVRC
jgi:hypothetical protein